MLVLSRDTISQKGEKELNMLVVTNWIWPFERPTNYGWYHIIWLVIMVISCIVISLTLAKKHDKKIDNRVIFAFGTLLVLIETYKQVFYTLEAGHYQWYAFPFQFCSVPMYVAFIAPLIRNEKIQDSMYKFLAFYGFLAGFAVMLYPDTCFQTPYTTILIHTMLWHTSMVVMGVYLLISREYASSLKNIVKDLFPGFIVLLVIIVISLIVNEVGYKLYFGTDKNVYNDTLFFMYLSPYYPSPLPILSTIKETTPYIVFLITYIVAFFLGITVMFMIVLGIRSFAKVFGTSKDKKLPQHS